MIRKLYFLTVIALGVLEGCATYHPMPLDGSTVAQRLMPPSMEAIRIEAKAIKHPILKPLDFDERNGLSPDEAAILAVLANPKLRAIRDQRGVAAAQLFQAGILPNPQLSYSLDIPTGGSTQGTVNAYNLGLSWDIVSLVSRGAKINAARAHAGSVDIDVAWQEWQVAEAARMHLFRLMLIGKQLDLAKEAEKGLRENLKVVNQAVNLGEKTVLDLSAAETALDQSRLSVLTLAQQQEQEHLELNKTLGLPSNSIIPIERNIAFPSWEALPSETSIIDGIEERRLDLLALKMGYESQEANLRAVVLSQFPKINIGFHQARDTTNVVTTGFGITVDLPFFDRNQGQIAIERATRKQLFDEYVARLFEARSEVVRVLSDMESTQLQLRTTEESLPTLERLVEIYHMAVQENNADILSYYEARNTLFSKRIDVLKLKRDLADLGIALEIATGQYFPGYDFSQSSSSEQMDGNGVPK
jgi:outer membrane protein, heavy metal efflux system